MFQNSVREMSSGLDLSQRLCLQVRKAHTGILHYPFLFRIKVPGCFAVKRLHGVFTCYPPPQPFALLPGCLSSFLTAKHAYTYLLWNVLLQVSVQISLSPTLPIRCKTTAPDTPISVCLSRRLYPYRAQKRKTLPSFLTAVFLTLRAVSRPL